jgi:hypothetical protein
MKLVLVALLLAIPIFADTCWTDRHEAREWRSEMRRESLDLRREAREARMEARRARVEFQREMHRTREEIRREVERDRREAFSRLAGFPAVAAQLGVLSQRSR